MQVDLMCLSSKRILLNYRAAIGYLTEKRAIKNVNVCTVSAIFPLVTTFDALIEDGGRLITRPDLNFFKHGALAAAITHVRALDRSHVCILECFSSTKDIVFFLPL